MLFRSTIYRYLSLRSSPQKLKFEEGGEIYNLWAKPPVDLYVRVYLFNVTNKEAFLSGADRKLNLQEVGPYVYK